MTTSATAHCYQLHLIFYNDYLGNNFDSIINQTNPLAQIYVLSKAANEWYTMKEMMQQPDQQEFVKVMKTKVQQMFQKNIWKKIMRL